MNRLRVMIVEDEPLARRYLRRMLSTDSELEVTAECATGLEAIGEIRASRPDLVFLDIQMPQMDAFEMLSVLREDEMPSFVFVTAYDHYALKAFEVHALDYICKPFDQTRLDRTLRRIKQQMRAPRAAGLSKAILDALGPANSGVRTPERILVKVGDGMRLLTTREIVAAAARDKYVELYTATRSFFHRETLSGLAARLDPKRFVRVHRSALVQLAAVQELRPLPGGEYCVRLNNGREFTLSRGYRDQFFDLLAPK